MKLLLASALLVTSTSFAQTLDVQGLKSLWKEKQSVLERINQGMSKKVITTSRIATELGPCEITATALQTVLKIEGAKMIVHSKEKYQPATSAACAGFQPQEVAVVFYEEKPTLATDLSDLDEAASQIKSISRSGEIVTLNLTATVGTRTESVTVKYDLTKPSFKNTILVQDSTNKVVTEEAADMNVNSIDLKKVLFCESANSDNCQEGDFSDILF